MNNKKLFYYINQHGGNSNNIIKINNLDSMIDFESSDVIDNTEDYTISLLDKILSNGSTNYNEYNNVLSDISSGAPFTPMGAAMGAAINLANKFGKKDISRASKKTKSNKNGDTKVKGIGSKIISNIRSQFEKRRDKKAKARKAQEARKAQASSTSTKQKHVNHQAQEAQTQPRKAQASSTSTKQKHVNHQARQAQTQPRKAQALQAQALQAQAQSQQAQAQAQALQAQAQSQQAQAQAQALQAQAQAQEDNLNFDELLGQLEALKRTLNNVNNNELDLKGMLSNLEKMKNTIIS